ncbi:MAG: dihydrofolate reductase [Anaerolineae bacterium]|nr:MAG: dihydrofolate reductase [Anaerolineae bacterium]
MIVSVIVAVEEGGGIGYRGGIPWKLKDDLKLFKETTMGHHLVVGRKTWESIGRALPGRKMLVVTRQSEYHAEGAEVVGSLSEALTLAQSRGETEVFIGGGAELYAEALPIADRLYYTRVLARVLCDTLFPWQGEMTLHEVERREFPANERNEYPFVWRVMERRM